MQNGATYGRTYRRIAILLVEKTTGSAALRGVAHIFPPSPTNKGWGRSLHVSCVPGGNKKQSSPVRMNDPDDPVSISNS
jgi:hypothetical protein